MRSMLLGVVSLAAAPLVAGPALAQPTVKIGLIMTYSGQFADAATQMDNGVKLYVKQHGDTVAGKKLEFIRRVEKVGGQLVNVEFDKIENVKDPFKARMKK